MAWKSYRDQWLSEAFAEYSAIMFIQNTMEKGPEYYDEIIQAYSEASLGGFDKPSKFLRSWAIEYNDQQRERVGPIGIGYRAATSTTPQGYFAQAYVKGAVMLHMLRTLCRHIAKSDELFVTILRDFDQTYEGRAALTEDFVAIVNKHAPGEWDWFFDQWIDGTAIPTYHWSYSLGKEDGKTVLELDIEQHDVPPGFRMPVPVKIDLGKGKAG